MLRGETTCDKPCSSEQSHLQSTIQDGRFRKSQILTKPRGLFHEDRSFGCLSIHSSPSRLTTIPGIYFQPGHVCFQNNAIQAKCGTSSIYKSFQTSFGRSEGPVYSSSHMARRYPSNLKFLFKFHSRSRHCYGPTSEPRISIKHGKVSPHSNSESHLPRYGDRFINHDIFSSRREGFSNCSKGNNSKEQESGIGKGNLPVDRNVLSYLPCSRGGSNPLLTASAPSDNLTDKKNFLLRNQCYSVKFMLLPLALQDVDWWIHNLSTSVSNPIILPPPDIYIQTDASDLGWGGYLEMVSTKSYPHFSSTCCRSSEHFCRATLPLSTVEHRMDAMQENIPSDRGSLWMSSGRSLCLIPKPPTKNILFLDSRPKSLKNRCIHFQLGFQSSLPVSSISSNSQMPFKDKKRQMQGNTNSPSVEIKTLVSNYFRDANGSPSSPPNQKDLLQLPLSNQTHPLLTDRKRNFKLASWPVSGNLSDSIKFLKGCPKLSLHHGGRVQKSITSLPGVNSIAGMKNDQLIRFFVL